MLRPDENGKLYRVIFKGKTFGRDVDWMICRSRENAEKSLAVARHCWPDATDFRIVEFEISVEDAEKLTS